MSGEPVFSIHYPLITIHFFTMDTSSLKNYAPRARLDFIAAVTRRAAQFGVTAKGASPVREEGQLVLIEGKPYPKAVGIQRQKLAARIEQQGFDQAMETAAYTWFNRFAAIRFMELHGYLDHSFRVLSHPAGNGLPEILEHARGNTGNVSLLHRHMRKGVAL